MAREVMNAPSLEVLSARLNGSLSSLVLWKESLPMTGVRNKMRLKVTSNLNHSMILQFYYILHMSKMSLIRWWAAKSEDISLT